MNKTTPLPNLQVASQHRSWWLGFALIYPTLLTLTYFLWLSQSSSGVQQLVYAIGKLIQFGFPIFYVLFLMQTPGFANSGSSDSTNRLNPNLDKTARLVDTPRRNLLIGIIFGVGVVVAMLTVFYWVLPESTATEMTERVQTKVRSMGLNSPVRFVALSIFYVVGHSFLEEYYWRWFVFGQLQQTLSLWKANLIAGLGFMAHHVVLLAAFFGWDSVFTYLLSFSVAVGGLFWAWLFIRRCGFRSAWLSHAIVDAGIFGLAMSILFR